MPKESEQNVNPEAIEIKSVNDFWNEVRKLYEPECLEIMDLIDQGQSVILDAGHGVGKNYNIVPVLEKIARTRGYNFATLDAMGSNPANFWEYYLQYRFTNQKPVDKRLIVIDEFSGYLHFHPDWARDILTRLAAESTSMIIFIPNPIKEGRLEETEKIKEIGKEIGITYTVHKLRQKYVPVELMRKYLEFNGAQQNLISFYLDPQNSALRSILLVYHFKDTKTMDALRNALEQGAPMTYLPYWIELIRSGYGGSKEEMLRMVKNLGLTDDNDWGGIVQYYKEKWVEFPDYIN